MHNFTRKSDGASVCAERYDGSSSSADLIMDLIGTMGVNNTEIGLLTPYGYVNNGSWVVKGRRDTVLIVSNNVFHDKFSRPTCHFGTPPTARPDGRRGDGLTRLVDHHQPPPRPA